MIKRRAFRSSNPWLLAVLLKENDTLKRVWEKRNCSFEVFLCAIGALGKVKSFDLDGSLTILILFLSDELFFR